MPSSAGLVTWMCFSGRCWVSGSRLLCPIAFVFRCGYTACGFASDVIIRNNVVEICSGQTHICLMHRLRDLSAVADRFIVFCFICIICIHEVDIICYVHSYTFRNPTKRSFMNVSEFVSPKIYQKSWYNHANRLIWCIQTYWWKFLFSRLIFRIMQWHRVKNPKA